MKDADYVALARKVATKLDLLDQQGDLLQMDSISLVDYVLAIEKQIGKRLSESDITTENFQSLRAVAALLTRVTA